jgi:hypothetical protein
MLLRASVGSMLLVLAAGKSDFDWIRDIAASSGGKFFLNATTYLIDTQYQLPVGTEIYGAGSRNNDGFKGAAVIRAVELHRNMSDQCNRQTGYGPG